eukprot:2778864-Pleurochrysis_carterae.AAC.1
MSELPPGRGDLCRQVQQFGCIPLYLRASFSRTPMQEGGFSHAVSNEECFHRILKYDVLPYCLAATKGER